MTSVLTTGISKKVVLMTGFATLLISMPMTEADFTHQELGIIVDTNDEENFILGWPKHYAAQVRNQLKSFEEHWDAPGMEDYDAL